MTGIFAPLVARWIRPRNSAPKKQTRPNCVACGHPAVKGENPLWPEVGEDGKDYLVHRNCRDDWWQRMRKRNRAAYEAATPIEPQQKSDAA